MKRNTSQLILCAALFAASLLPVAAPAGENQKHPQPDNKRHPKSGIIGRIVELPGPWYIRIEKIGPKRDHLTEEIQADNNGFFEVDLKPGVYSLTPHFPSIDGTGELIGVSAGVTVEKKEFTTVELLIVHGPD